MEPCFCKKCLAEYKLKHNFLWQVRDPIHGMLWFWTCSRAERSDRISNKRNSFCGKESVYGEQNKLQKSLLSSFLCSFYLFKNSLREKCPNTDFFLVRFFLYSDWIQIIQSEYRKIQSIQSEYRKIRSRKNSVFGHFSRSDLLANFIALIHKLYEFKLKIMVLSSIKMMLRISLMWNKFCRS